MDNGPLPPLGQCTRGTLHRRGFETTILLILSGTR